MERRFNRILPKEFYDESEEPTEIKNLMVSFRRDVQMQNNRYVPSPSSLRISPSGKSKPLIQQRLFDESLAESNESESKIIRLDNTSETRDLKRKIVQEEADLLQARNELSRCKFQFQRQEIEFKEAIIQFETELACAKRCEQTERERRECLEQELQSERKIRHSLQSELALDFGTERCNKIDNRALQEECKTLREKNYALQEEIGQLTRQFDLLKAQKNNEAETLRSSVMSLKSPPVASVFCNDGEGQCRTAAKLENDVRALKIALSRANKEKASLSSQIDEVKIHDVAVNRQKLAEFPVLKKRNELLERENQLYKDTQVNSDILKEKIASLEFRLEAAVSKISDYEKIIQQSLSIHENIEAFEAIVVKLGLEPKSPESLSRYITESQRKEAAVKLEVAELKRSVASLTRSISQSEETIEKISNERNVSASTITEQAKLIKRLQRKLLLVSKERDSVKSVLESYQSELTLTGSQLENVQICALENDILFHKKTIEQLESQLEMVSLGSSSEELKELKKCVAKLTEENKQLVHSSLAAKNDSKVIHLSMNPLSEAIANRSNIIEKLRTENESLRARVDLLLKGETHDLTALVGQQLQQQVSTKDVEDLRCNVASLETKNLRLVQAFQKTSQDYREAILALTGYRIDSKLHGQFRVTSVYAERESDFLMFYLPPADKRHQRDSQVQLLETSYSVLVSDLARKHIGNQQSIPMFLAALTIDLFSKQKLFGDVSTSMITNEVL